MSGGESQRIAIARAIINDPDIILADEPTGSLDMKTAKDIFALLNNQKKRNRLIIFATHNRFFAKKADYLLELTKPIFFNNFSAFNIAIFLLSLIDKLARYKFSKAVKSGSRLFC